MDAGPDGGKALLANRSFTRLWAGYVLSESGTQAMSVAMPLLVLSLTHSPAKAGLVGAARAVALPLSALPAGVLADRFHRSSLMFGCAVVRAAAMATVVLVLVLARPPLAQLMVVGFVAGALETVAAVAERGLLTAVIPPDALPDAVAANEARMSVASVAGPTLGALLIGVARSLPFAADGASDMLAALAVLGVRPTREQERPEHAPTIEAVRKGLLWLWRIPFLRDGSLLYAAANVTFGAAELTGILIARRHGASSAAIGVAFAIIGVGGIAGALMAGPLRRRLPARWSVMSEAWIAVGCVPLLLLCRSAFPIGIVIGVMALPMATSTSIVVSRRMLLTPDYLRGRVQATASLIASSIYWIGPLAVGLLFQHTGETATVLTLTGWTLAIALAATLAKGFRHVPAIPTEVSAIEQANQRDMLPVKPLGGP